MRRVNNPEAMRRIAALLRLAIYALMLLAAGSMLYQYAFNFSMWRDEAALANNIVNRDFSSLLQPLDYNQAAPVGFLLVTKVVTLFLGTGEYALRLLPLLLGLSCIVLFYHVGRMIAPPALIFGMALLATSPMHIRYAAEFKQYIGDSFWALLLTLLALQFMENKRMHTLYLYAIAGIAAVWFSHPAVFVLAGIGCVLFFEAVRQRSGQQMTRLIGIGIAQLVSFGLVYGFSYRHVSGGTQLATNMNTYWQEKFLRFEVISVVQSIFEPLIWVSGVYEPVLFILVIFGLIVSIPPINKRVLAVLLAPALFMYVASALEYYPISHRMLLFFVPGLMMLVAFGWWRVIENVKSDHPRISMGLLLLFLTAVLIRVEFPLRTSDTIEAREALAWAASSDADDPLLVTARIAIIADYYDYEYRLLGAEVPEGRRYWMLIDEDIDPHALNPREARSIYPFINVTAICFPGDMEACPPHPS